MEQRMTIIGLGVKDLKASTTFYEEKFGWKKTNASNEFISFFQLNGILLSLYPKDKLAEDAEVSPEGSGFKAFTLAYNTRSQQEVDAIINTLRAKGVTIIKEPQKVFWGGYSSYVADIDNNLWEVAYNPYLALDEAGNALE
ncbi:VOC family protein [Spongiivirga sp. MCCC 1A20706]|uniref:VOC family protein n=1 Tax=Spongiivirga sp. MCCC 1A20706 TaxID=3160963 RepID=UPI003977C1D6